MSGSNLRSLSCVTLTATNLSFQFGSHSYFAANRDIQNRQQQERKIVPHLITDDDRVHNALGFCGVNCHSSKNTTESRVSTWLEA